jgi:CRP/FNR family cyclic AMP-dependent transcriptional regulator
MNPDQAAGLLSKSQLFSRLDQGALRAVAAQASTRTYRKGALLFYQGDPGDAFYVLAEGRVKVFVTSGQGQEMVLVTLGPPDAVGEVALLDDGPRSASVEALEPVTALAFARSRVLELLLADPRLTAALLGSAGALLRRLTGQAGDLVFLDLEGRVAKVLVEMAERGDGPTTGVLTVDVGLTQSDLGAMVGGTRQSVNQSLHALEARGFIRVHGRIIEIAEPDALRRRAGSG